MRRELKYKDNKFVFKEFNRCVNWTGEGLKWLEEGNNLYPRVIKS